MVEELVVSGVLVIVELVLVVVRLVCALLVVLDVADISVVEK